MTANSAEKHPADAIADVIEEYGWTQRRFGHIGLGFCVSGAGGFIYNDFWFINSQIYLKVVNRINSYYGWTVVGYGTISSWNDEPGRTKEEVLRVLRSRK